MQVWPHTAFAGGPARDRDTEWAVVATRGSLALQATVRNGQWREPTSPDRRLLRTMGSGSSLSETTSVAASVAPEDLQRGDFVAILHEVAEYPSFFWMDAVPCERDAMVRVRCLPADSGQPLKVKAICLPFLFVESPRRRLRTLDVRQVQLARLTRRYAKTVWTAFRKR